MKKLFLAASIIAASTAHADSSSVNTGSAMTLGPSSSLYSLSSASFNPAMNSLVIKDGESMRMSYFPTFGFNLEIGQADNFADDLEELADIIDDPDSTDDTPGEVLERFNKVLEAAGEDGYVKINAGMNMPLLPLYFYSETLGGTIGVDVSLNVQAGISLLDSELYYDQQNSSFVTASALYLKSGLEQTLALSYSREVYNSDSGKLYAGAKFKYINMELSKQVIPLVELAGEDMGDLIQDEYDKNQVTSSDYGIDFGLVWDAKHYRLGLTFENINSPEFEYGEIGVNCSEVPENTPARSNCEAASYFTNVTGEIKANEVHTKHALMRADALVNVTERLQISTAIDLAKYDDIVGDDNQWFHTALAYDSDWYVLPSVRVGYHKNLTGNETSSLTAGLSLFKIVSLDFEYGLESVEVDDSSAPRRVGFSLSIQEQF
ncbi:MAG: conjugal transfer protein TraF [Thalassotalea sp.]